MKLLAIVISLVLAGCGATTESRTVTIEKDVTVTESVSTSTSTSGAATIYLSPSKVATSCIVYMDGHDARVQFSAYRYIVAPECTSWIEIAAQAGSLWTQNEITPAATLGVVCSLVDAQGNVWAAVLDSGGQIYGTQACTALLASGWTEVQ